VSEAPAYSRAACAESHRRTERPTMNTRTAARSTQGASFIPWLALPVLAGSLLFTASHAFAQGNSNAHANANGVANRADNGRNRIADDLNDVLNGRGNGNAHWVQNGPGGPTYSVIITANADAARSDRQLNGIRRSVLAIGGS